MKYISKSGKSKIKYLDTYIALDTETAHNHDIEKPIAWVYQWAFLFDGKMYSGRYVTELVQQLHQIALDCEAGGNKRIVCYVHNLSYDITYLHKFLIQEFNTEPKILAIKPHKILTYIIGGIEFRCSYLLSNMSLDKWAEHLNCTHKKLVGAINYDKIITPNDTLTETQWDYQYEDVYTLSECIDKTLEYNNDTITTIPLTSTGYVRRDVRNATKKDKSYRKWFVKTALDVDSYKVAKSAFSGGYTHGNRFYCAKVIKDNIGHYDFKSEYPSVQMLEYFPMGRPQLLYKFNIDKPLNFDLYKTYCNNYCVFGRVFFQNGKLKKEVTAPYIQVSKIVGKYALYDDRGVYNASDNGRVVNFKGWITMCVTELDLDIILSQYDFDNIVIGDTYISERGSINPLIKTVINNYFTVKESEQKGYYRDKTKNKLNGIYGMTATDIFRDTWDLQNDEWVNTVLRSDENIKATLDKYYKSYNSFNNYLHGVYTTAHARHWLIKTMIADIIGYDNYIYSDTDSVFFIANEEIIKRIEYYNNKMIALNKKLGYGVKNVKGGMSYYGTFEDEQDNIKQFKFLHAKCYAYVNDSGLHCTIAGVTAKNKVTGITKEQELQDIDNLRSGFTFKECGGTRALYTYNDISTYVYNDCNIPYADSCIILPVEKTLSCNIESIPIIDYDR